MELQKQIQFSIDCQKIAYKVALNELQKQLKKLNKKDMSNKGYSERVEHSGKIQGVEACIKTIEKLLSQCK